MDLVLKNFIGGCFQEQPESLEYLEIKNPATDRVYTRVPRSGEADVEKAYSSAKEAFHGWSSLSPSKRSQFMMKLADAIENSIDAFAEAESRDQGKPFWLAKSVDIPRSIYNFRYFASFILHQQEHCRELHGIAHSYTVSSPVGIAGLISPWNLPLYLLTWKIAPAIAVGNTVVCKPSEFTSLTAFMLCQKISEIGFPKGVVNMVFGDGMTGNYIVSHPKIPLISFTGGTVTGQKILAASAKFIKKVSLELGGKNANIIFGDANLEKAVETSIRSSFLNQGEICLCGSRIYVERCVYSAFLERFAEKTRQLVVGDPMDPETKIGPLVSADHMNKVLSYIEIARKEGADILVGGLREKSLEPGYFLQPTIITNIKPDSRVVMEEIFGPVVTVLPFDSEEEVIEAANSVKYGLSASIWTESQKRSYRISKRLEVGTVWVNCWLVRDLSMPFGGIKESGIGREGGQYSMEFFTEKKTICSAIQ